MLRFIYAKVHTKSQTNKTVSTDGLLFNLLFSRYTGARWANSLSQLVVYDT